MFNASMLGLSFTSTTCCPITNSRNAKKSGTKFLSNVVKTVFKQFSMWVFLPVSHYNTKGKLMVFLYIYILIK